MMQLVKQLVLGVAVNKDERLETVKAKKNHESVRKISSELIVQIKKKNNEST